MCGLLESSVHNIFQSGEPRDFTILKTGGFLLKPLDSGKTFFDITANTDEICMGFEAVTPGK